MTPLHWWVRQILWIDGLGALAAGIVVLGLRRFFAGLYEFPLDLITTIGVANLAFAALALTPATSKRRRAGWIAALAIANLSWALVCVFIVVRFSGNANALGQAHVFVEGVWVAMLGSIEWRNRHRLTAAR